MYVFLHGQKITNSMTFCYVYNILKTMKENDRLAFHNPAKYQAQNLIDSAKYESVQLRELLNVEINPQFSPRIMETQSILLA